MQFIDEATITVAGGRGGDGIVAWRREKYVPKGGPAGGDGGKGRGVVLEAHAALGTLIDFRFKKHFGAESGKPGGGSNKSGKSADDLIVRVPLGTLVYRLEDEGREMLVADLGEPEQRVRVGCPIATFVYRLEDEGREMLGADLGEPQQRVRVARGGRGGLGNQHFATSTRQAPRFAEKGEPPETASLRLALKLLADCGITGLAHAGKSTLLAAVSAARPKIADYPFTTLEPQLGVVRLGP